MNAGFRPLNKCSINVADLREGRQLITIFVYIMEDRKAALTRFIEERDSAMEQVGNVFGYGELSLGKRRFSSSPEIVFLRDNVMVDILSETMICSEQELVELGKILYEHVAYLQPN